MRSIRSKAGTIFERARRGPLRLVGRGDAEDYLLQHGLPADAPARLRERLIA